MRSTILFACILSVILVFAEKVNAQMVPQFQTTIYVEDAVGNRDSVVVEFDTLATTGIDAQFGEVEITAPFDSVLEVRAGTFLGFEKDQLSEVLIEPSQAMFHPTSPTYGCFSSVPIFVYIWAKHQPVSISWDSTAFLENICVRGSLLSNHWADEVATPYDWDFLPQNEYYCLADRSNFIVDLSAEAIIQADVIQPVVIEKEVQGMGVQEIYGLRFFPSPTFTAWTPCFYITATAEVNSVREITVSPNPTSANFRIQMPEEVIIEHVEIIDSQGKPVFSAVGSQTMYDIGKLSSGFYFITIMGDDKNLYFCRIIKE